MVKNVTCNTKISTTTHLISSFNYTISKKPHDSDHGQIKRRALAVHGIGCSDNPTLAKQQMIHVLKMAGVSKNNIHNIREIKSFNNLDYHKESDRKTALNLNDQMMKSEHPNCMIYLALQADGHGHHLHIHNNICPRNLLNLKSITHSQTDWTNYLKPITDRVMKKNGYQIEYNHAHSTQNRSLGETYHVRKGDSWVANIRSKLNHARLNSLTPRQYVQNVRKAGINIEFAKMHTVNGKRVPHYYKTAGKDPKGALQVTHGKHQGQYIRVRKHFSYSFIHKGKKYKIRDKKLGSDFFVPNLMKQFYINNRNKSLSRSKSINSSSHQTNPQKQKQIHHQSSIHPTKASKTPKMQSDPVNHAPKIKSGSNSKNKSNPKITFKDVSIKGFTQRNYKNKLGHIRSLDVPIHHKTMIFHHMPFIQLLHMPSMPLMRLVDTNNSQAKQIANEKFNSDQIDKFQKQYADYSFAKATKQDVINITRAENNEIRRINNQRRFTR